MFPLWDCTDLSPEQAISAVTTSKLRYCLFQQLGFTQSMLSFQSVGWFCRVTIYMCRWRKGFFLLPGMFSLTVPQASKPDEQSSALCCTDPHSRGELCSFLLVLHMLPYRAETNPLQFKEDAPILEALPLSPGFVTKIGSSSFNSHWKKDLCFNFSAPSLYSTKVSFIFHTPLLQGIFQEVNPSDRSGTHTSTLQESQVPLFNRQSTFGMVLQKSDPQFQNFGVFKLSRWNIQFMQTKTGLPNLADTGAIQTRSKEQGKLRAMLWLVAKPGSCH